MAQVDRPHVQRGLGPRGLPLCFRGLQHHLPSAVAACSGAAAGMPRRVQYAGMLKEHPDFQFLHVLSSIGSYLLAIGLFGLVLFYLLRSLFTGKRATADSRAGPRLEWQCSSPPPHDNFSSPPVVGDPYERRKRPVRSVHRRLCPRHFVVVAMRKTNHERTKPEREGRVASQMLAKSNGGFLENGAVLSPEGATLDGPGQRPGEPVVLSSFQAPTGPTARPCGEVVSPFRAGRPWVLRVQLHPGLSSGAPSGLSKQSTT